MTSMQADAADGGANPFAAGSEIAQGCWQLGRHDGRRELDPVTDSAIAAVADEGRVASRQRLRDGIADLKGRLKTAEEVARRSARDIDDHSRHLLAHLGRQPVGLLQWLVPCGYVALAAVAVVAESPLSILTVGESAMGNLNAAQMDSVRGLSAWALGGMMCLLGFSLKLLADAVERATWRRWLEPPLVLAAVALSVVSLVGIAHLRESIGAQATALLVNAPADVQLSAARLVADWSDFTFKWVTLTLPALSAACLIVAFHQYRDFRLHNRALKGLRAADAIRLASVKDVEVLDCQITAGERDLSDLEALDVAAPDVLDRYRACYVNGAATGRHELQTELSKDGVYLKMKRAVARCA